jgi:MFS family permease
MSDADFKAWGWRIPFLLSSILVVVSYYIRARMAESPLFREAQSGRQDVEGAAHRQLRDGGAVESVLHGVARRDSGAGGGLVHGPVLRAVLHADRAQGPVDTAYKIVAISLVLGTPFFIVFGSLSDRIGRKKIIMTGCALAALTYIPIYHAMSAAADPLNFWGLVGLMFIQVIYVTMVYGPIAAFLVESFPARIRYTSLSLPYHFGNGWFGGFTPVIATSIVAATGNRYAGLWFPDRRRNHDLHRRQLAAARDKAQQHLERGGMMIRRLMCLATFLLCASTTWAQRPLKVYISADMEGITGVASADQLSPAGFEYSKAREWMTAEVLAAIQGSA